MKQILLIVEINDGSTDIAAKCQCIATLLRASVDYSLAPSFEGLEAILKFIRLNFFIPGCVIIRFGCVI